MCWPTCYFLSWARQKPNMIKKKKILHELMHHIQLIDTLDEWKISCIKSAIGLIYPLSKYRWFWLIFLLSPLLQLISAAKKNRTDAKLDWISIGAVLEGNETQRSNGFELNNFPLFNPKLSACDFFLLTYKRIIKIEFVSLSKPEFILLIYCFNWSSGLEYLDRIKEFLIIKPEIISLV